jgi:hypothetical protein
MVKDSQIASQNLVRLSPSLSAPGEKMENLIGMQHVNKKHPKNDMSGPVTTGQENVEWSGRQDSNSKPAPHNQVVTTKDSQRDSQSANPIPDHDLQRVINAWCNLPANLKAAIMAIVGPDSLSHR